MTSSDFGKSLGYLKAIYPNWKLDITDEFVLAVWYQQFMDIDYKQFTQVIKKFASDNKYPPQSPRDLLEVYESMFTPQVLTCDEAWDKMLEIARANGHFRSYPRQVFKALEEYPLICKCADKYYDKLYGLTVDDYQTQKEWKAYYNKMCKEYLKPNVELLAIKDPISKDYYIGQVNKEVTLIGENKSTLIERNTKDNS